MNRKLKYGKKPDKLIKRYLRHDFSDADRAELAKELASANLRKKRVEDEKKSVNSDFKSRIDRLDADINKLSQSLSSDFEMRNVECEVYYDLPEKGLKTIVNGETHETVSVEKMEPDEMQMPLSGIGGEGVDPDVEVLPAGALPPPGEGGGETGEGEGADGEDDDEA